MFHFEELYGFIYVADFLFIAALATIIIKLVLEKSSQGFSAKAQGVYGVVICTRNIDLLFVEGSALYLAYNILKKLAYILCIIYIVFKIKNTSKHNPTCSCNQDGFWVEALVLPCIIVTAVFHYGSSPEEVLWSFSTYLEMVAMIPQFYLIQVRGKGDSYLPAYIALMAAYSLIDALVFCLNSFVYGNMPVVWPVCKCVQLTIYFWYIIIPREPVLPVANCEERKRRTTFFMRQQSMLAQTLLKKNNSAQDLQVFTVTSPASSTSVSICSMEGKSLEDGSNIITVDTPPPSPCLKFDPKMETESFKLKAPRLNIKPLKNKATLKITSLPSSPQCLRKCKLHRSTSAISSFKLINEFTQFETAMSSRAKRKKRIRLSLTNSPETIRKFTLNSKADVLNRSLSEIDQAKIQTYKGKPKKKCPLKSNISLPTTPELIKKSELILKVHPNKSSYTCLSHLPLCHPYKICPHAPTLLSVEGSPSVIKKCDKNHDRDSLNILKKLPPLKDSLPVPISCNSSPPLLRKENEIQSPHSKTEQISTIFLELNESKDVTKAIKSKRPVLPKLIISAPDTGDADIHYF